MVEARTLYDKIWDSHVVHEYGDGTSLLYIDQHLIHEVTTPQPFEGLLTAGRKVRRTDATLAVADHDIPTTADAYIHRIGRTGRAERSGEAFNLVTADDHPMLRAIDRVVGTRIEHRILPDFDYKTAAKSARDVTERPARSWKPMRKPVRRSYAMQGRAI